MLFTEGDMHMVSLRPTPSEAYHTAYSISSNDGRLKIKEWSKVMNVHTQIIGDKMNVRKPQVGDRLCPFSIMVKDRFICFMVF